VNISYRRIHGWSHRGASGPSVRPPPPPPTYSYGPPPPWTAPPTQAAPKSNRNTIIIVAVVVVVVLLAVILIGAAALRGPTTATPGSQLPPNNTPPPETLIASGQVWQLTAGHYEYVGPLNLSGAATVTGAFSATGGSGANAFILTPSEQQTFGSGSSSTPSSYVWTSGDVSTGSVNTNLQAGNYYVDFVNQATFSTTSVQVTTSFVATFDV
jgi:hypothetical protein